MSLPTLVEQSGSPGPPKLPASPELPKLPKLAGLPIQRVSQGAPLINMLVYGESGIGKTRIAGSADAVPAMRRVLLIDVEGGTLTLRDTYPEVETVRVKTWAEMQGVYDALFAGNHGYTTIIIDSITEIQKMSMAAVMRRLMEEDGTPGNDIPSLREWGINLEQTRKFVRAFRDLPVNTVFTALVKTDKNPRNGAIKRKPSLSGKLSDEIAGFLDIVVYLYAKEINGEHKRILLCGQTEDTVAKDRSNKLPMLIEDPTMTNIWELLHNKENHVALEG